MKNSERNYRIISLGQDELGDQNKVIENVAIQGLRLSEFLYRYSATYNIVISVDENISMLTPVYLEENNISALQMLDCILKSLNLGYEFKNATHLLVFPID